MNPEKQKMDASEQVRLALLSRIQELEAKVAELQSDLDMAKTQMAK